MRTANLQFQVASARAFEVSEKLVQLLKRNKYIPVGNNQMIHPDADKDPKFDGGSKWDIMVRPSKNPDFDFTLQCMSAECAKALGEDLDKFGQVKITGDYRQMLAAAAEEVTALNRDIRRLRASVEQRSKTAGEVRFIKDKGGTAEWAWDSSRHSNERAIPKGHEFNPKKAKILVRLLRSTAMALGHTMSAYTQLAKARSCEFSPDGLLGGVGYVKKISGIRQEYNNIIEALSSLTDTYHDEINAPHWTQALKKDPEAQEEVEEMMDTVEDIRYSPEGFARKQELEQEQEARRKKASTFRRLQASFDTIERDLVKARAGYA